MLFHDWPKEHSQSFEHHEANRVINKHPCFENHSLTSINYRDVTHATGEGSRTALLTVNVSLTVCVTARVNFNSLTATPTTHAS
jgi:hypothetical protein